MSARYLTGASTVNATNNVTLTYTNDVFVPSFGNGTGFFRLLPRAEATFQIGASQFDCAAPSSASLDIQLGARAGASTTVSVFDSSIELISIRAKFPGTSGPATIVQRWVDATLLADHEPVPLLTASQQTALASLGAASEYEVGLYHVVWDEDRKLWPDGRVIPVACGTALLFEASDVVP